ncbi:hypothetical protein [Rhodococcus sp. NCIMB 12038]|uniref:hypothetical protein n=1 Tax=Rhodococcus sp. NCIMB 12038 TaxID=933800 RepID=UPI00211AAEC8|nr:hypothetical protein [Rhodococcus sp. NCIMB 12038]
MFENAECAVAVAGFDRSDEVGEIAPPGQSVPDGVASYTYSSSSMLNSRTDAPR